MDAELIKMLISSKGLGPAVMVAGVWALKELVGLFKKDNEKRDQALIALNTTLHENTLALTKLTVQMEYLNKSVDQIPEMRKDIDGLGDKVRKLQKELPNGT